MSELYTCNMARASKRELQEWLDREGEFEEGYAIFCKLYPKNRLVRRLATYVGRTYTATAKRQLQLEIKSKLRAKPKRVKEPVVSDIQTIDEDDLYLQDIVRESAKLVNRRNRLSNKMGDTGQGKIRRARIWDDIDSINSELNLLENKKNHFINTGTILEPQNAEKKISQTWNIGELRRRQKNCHNAIYYCRKQLEKGNGIKAKHETSIERYKLRKARINSQINKIREKEADSK